MKITYQGYERRVHNHRLIDQPIKKCNILPEIWSEEGVVIDEYFSILGDQQNSTTTLKFVGRISGKGTYSFSVKFTVEELLFLLKSHLKEKSFEEIATMLVDLNKPEDSQSSDVKELTEQELLDLLFGGAEK